MGMYSLEVFIMPDVEVTLHLPEALVKEATILGILSSEAIETLLRAEIQTQLAAMANDPDIQREIAEIEAEFSSAGADGLDDES
jgi:hypothetical protein